MPETLETFSPSTFGKRFRGTFMAIGALEVYFAGMTILQGPSKVMSQFGIPEAVIKSTHYADAMLWVMVNMFFIGTITASAGMLI